MRSLGRAKGFAVIGEHSAFDDPELISLLTQRVFILYNLLNSGEETQKDRIITQQIEQLVALDQELKEYRKRIADLEDETEEVGDREQHLLEEINRGLGSTLDFMDLGEAVEALIVEYQEALEEAEDNV
jgi:hypothetical protein